MITRASKVNTFAIEPLIKSQGLDTDREKIVMGTVEGDVHSIGPKIVAPTCKEQHRTGPATLLRTLAWS